MAAARRKTARLWGVRENTGVVMSADPPDDEDVARAWHATLLHGTLVSRASEADEWEDVPDGG